MIAFPNAKINLGLNIVRKRADGYHDIESCLYSIPWCDVLEIVPSERLTFHPSGLPIPGDAGNNLCLKAYQEVHKRFPDLPAVAIYLHKVIPMGAGLGGGSSDGAFMVKLLNDQFGLGMSLEEMETIAATLGSDCPFFIKNTPMLATGTGTKLEPLEVDLSGKYLGVVYPNVHVSTQEAYAGTKPAAPVTPVAEVLTRPIPQWKGLLVNDFEVSIFPNHRELQAEKEKMYEMGAIYAAMSGSGSAVFGIFETDPGEGFEFSCQL